MWPHGLHHARLLCPLLSPRFYSNSCSLSPWCYLTISSSVTPFPSLLQSFPATGSFPRSLLFPSGGQSTGASDISPSTNIQDWFPLGFTGLISSQSSGLSRVFNITLQKHQFFGIQPSLWSNSHIHEMDLCWQSDVSDFYTMFKFIKDFLPRSKHLLISWPQSTSTVILSPRKGNLPLLHFSPSICHEVMVLDAMILVFSMLSFKPAFSFSSFTLNKRLFSSSSLSDVRVVSSACL